MPPPHGRASGSTELFPVIFHDLGLKFWRKPEALELGIGGHERQNGDSPNNTRNQAACHH